MKESYQSSKYILCAVRNSSGFIGSTEDDGDVTLNGDVIKKLGEFLYLVDVYKFGRV